MAVEAGQVHGFLGPNGSGKTTTLRTLLGLIRPNAGRMYMLGEEVPKALPRIIGQVGAVVESPQFFPHFSARDSLSLLADAGSVPRRRVDEVLELVGLRDRADSDPAQLSGGERQRVAVARALAPEPALILLDEPFSSLDAALRVRLRADVSEVLRATGSTALWVTHDQEEALSLADRVVVMRSGRALQVGTPAEVYWSPVDAWTAAFLGEVNVVPGRIDGGGVHTTLGRFVLSASAPDSVTAVGIRPEAIGLERAGGSEAVISTRAFRGRDVLYEVTHPTLGRLQVQTASFGVLDVGEPVRLFPLPGARAIPLADGVPAVASGLGAAI
jgi:iron(III) transport system ATP-binding protein